MLSSRTSLELGRQFSQGEEVPLRPQGELHTEDEDEEWDSEVDADLATLNKEARREEVTDKDMDSERRHPVELKCYPSSNDLKQI